MDIIKIFGLLAFERHADGDNDYRLVRNCGLFQEAVRQLDLAIRDGNEKLEAEIVIYMRQRVEVAIGTAAETIVGMAAKSAILHASDTHRDLLAESLANDSFRIYNQVHGEKFSAARAERRMKRERS